MEDTTINVDIVWCKDSHEIKFGNGKILISNCQIIVSADLTNLELKDFSSTYPAGIGLKEDLGKCVRYSNARIKKQRVNLKKHLYDVLSWKCSPNNRGLYTMSWEISELSYTYKSEPMDSYVILNYPYLLLSSKGIVRDKEAEGTIGINNGRAYEFLPALNINHTKLKIRTEDILEELLPPLSFYFNSHITIIKSCIYKQGKIKVYIHTPFLEIKKYDHQHPELVYLEIPECDYGFGGFLRRSLWNSMSELKKKVLIQAIYTFCRCKYCDATTQFLLLYSILDNFAGNTYGQSPYEMKRKILRESYNIAIEKVGAINDPQLQKMQLFLKRDDGKEVCVSNFCLLRNYILHFMSRPEIDEYLEKSSLISRLRFCTCIIILQELGFNNLHFRKDWEHLSIFVK